MIFVYAYCVLLGMTGTVDIKLSPTDMSKIDKITMNVPAPQFYNFLVTHMQSATGNQVDINRIPAAFRGLLGLKPVDREGKVITVIFLPCEMCTCLMG